MQKHSKILLQIDDLRVDFFTEDGPVHAVDGVSFEVYRGETLGIVGESGCGKSVTTKAILGINPKNGSRSQGEILFNGENLLTKTTKEMQKIRGKDISMIFQDPMTSLNPVFTIGQQINEVLMLHQNLNSKEAYQEAISMLKAVGIPLPEQRFNEYPHMLSGGMRQRVMIAIAMACRPQLLIADEPTTALDVTIQAQILQLMKKMKADFQTSIIFITHDLGVIARMAERIIVMYAGKVLEKAATQDLYANPLHPYTEGLLRSIPRLDQETERLNVIQGAVPNAFEKIQGCRFHPRCDFTRDVCRQKEPELMETAPGHFVRCWLHQKAGEILEQ